MSLILLVEDDEQLAELTTAGLRVHGYEVVRAENGNAALDVFRKQRPDLVLTDLVMPQKEGWSLIGELRRRQPDVKIVAMTGGGPDDPRTYLKLAQHLGAQGVLEKPFTLHRLLEVLHRVERPAA